jgi:replicative DNA helicase
VTPTTDDDGQGWVRTEWVEALEAHGWTRLPDDEERPEDRAALHKAQAFDRLGRALGEALPMLPADERRILGRAVAEVSRERAKAGKPPLTADPLAIITAALDEEATRPRLVPGDAFAFDRPPTPPARWGNEDLVIWREQGPLWIVGPTGIGKSTMALRLALALIGVGDGGLLGYPVTPVDGLVVYLAADRPAQLADNLARMVGPADRTALHERLAVHKGPLPWDLARQPDRLAEWLAEIGARAFLVDSLKDVATDLATDETGGRVNRAFQLVTAAGIDLAVCHHQRKAGREGAKPKTLDDVYGSSLLVNGADSVLRLWGTPGDPVVELAHLKAPTWAELSPMLVNIGVDGTVAVHEGTDLLGWLRGFPQGVEVAEAARFLYGSTDKAPKERTRRALEGLTSRGYLHKQEGTRGGEGGGQAARYLPTTTEEPLDL